MHQKTSLFSQTFGALYALRSLAIAYFSVTFVLSLVEVWIEDNLIFSAIYAPFGAVFGFYFFCQLLGLTKGQRGAKLFVNFAFWYVILMHVVVIAGVYLLSMLYEALPAEAQNQDFAILVYSLSVMLVIFAFPYFLGTALPAQILGMQKDIWKAPARTIRQTSYLLPRFLGVLLPVLLFSGALFAVVGLSAPEDLPITYSGEVNSFSFLMLAISKLLGVLWEAVFMAVATNAYLKDLRERGEIPAVDAEVFA